MRFRPWFWAALAWAWWACVGERSTAPPVAVERAVPDSLNEGLVVTALSGVTWRSRDDETFRRRAAAIARAFGFAVREAFCAQEFLDTLKCITARRGALPMLYLIAHGDSNGIFFAPQQGLYHERILDPAWNPDDLYGGGDKQAFFSDWERALKTGEIRLGAGAALLGCYGAEWAERTARASNAFVLAPLEKCGPVNDGPQETGIYLADGGFVVFPFPRRPQAYFLPQKNPFPLTVPPAIQSTHSFSPFH